MRTGRSISMDSKIWTPVGEIADTEFDGDVSATIEMLCKGALKTRAGDDMMLSDEAIEVIDDWMNVHGFETRYLALQDLLLEFRERMRQEEQDYKQEVCAQIEHENKEPEED